MPNIYQAYIYFVGNIHGRSEDQRSLISKSLTLTKHLTLIEPGDAPVSERELESAELEEVVVQDKEITKVCAKEIVKEVFVLRRLVESLAEALAAQNPKEKSALVAGNSTVSAGMRENEENDEYCMKRRRRTCELGN